ncbi:MAG TPA: CHASE2 domain-containing protein [Thermoanaerobaculia bacterium]|nr:CHASE2 domain-containing protein [Thermoanaerobaculia bacterium]
MRILYALLAAVAVTALLAFGAMDAVELPVRDVAMRALPGRAASATVVVAIDEQSLREVGPWPWPRARLAQVIATAADGEARGVLVDVLLAEPREGDEALAAAMRRVPTVAVAVLDEHGEWLAPPFAARAAHGNFELDHDGIMRRVASTKQSRDRALTALSLEAASLVTGRPIPVAQSIAPAFRTRPRDVPRISASRLTRNAPIRGKLVFIGPTAFGTGDRVLTPVSGGVQDPGVTVHAAATESLIRGETIRALPPIVAGLLAAGAVAAILMTQRPRLMAAAGGIVIVGGGLALLGAGTAIPFVILLLTVAITISAVEAGRMTRALRESRARREQDAESKRLLAHELKTPLASMRGLSQLLAGFELTDAERRRVAGLLESEAGKLQSLVSVLLDLERLSLRNFGQSSSVIDLGELAGARLELLRAGADRDLMLQAERGVFVRADAALLERVMDNLVGNALKYTASPITVSVHRRASEAVLEVADGGPGIAAEERARIFDRFFRGTTAGGTQGLGLGLSLVAEVARWHGGAVTLDEAEGGGSRFRVALPLAAARAEAM